MKRKQLIDLITAIVLIIIGSLVLIFPLLKLINVKYIFIGVLSFYGVMNLLQFLLTSKDKDFEGLYTMIASIISIFMLGVLDTGNGPLNIALVLFVWIALMSFVKLIKTDYYHDRKKKIWLLRMVLLFLFILVGLLSVINLYYEEDTQILVLGFFYLTHGILELIDPIVNFIIEKR